MSYNGADTALLNDILVEILERLTPPPVLATSYEKSNWVMDKVGRAIPKLDIALLDPEYRMASQTDFLNIVAWDWIDRKQYLKTWYDCENFAFSFKAMVDRRFHLNQVGVVIDWSSSHAYNLVVFPTGNVMLFEPQTDSLIFIGLRLWVLYGLNDGLILI